MPKLSPRYRNDQPDGLPKEIRNYLDKNFLEKLENLHQPNPKLLIVFSGGNAMGKTTLSQKIQQECKALVLENDAIKACLLTFDPTADRDRLNVLTWQYSMDLYARLDKTTPNGLIVRDGVIDWYYDRILPVFEKQHYPVFVIGYEVSQAKRIELIKHRGDKATVSVERLIKLLEDHDVHTKRFRSTHNLDAVLADDNLFDYDEVIAKIRRRLADLKE